MNPNQNPFFDESGNPVLNNGGGTPANTALLAKLLGAQQATVDKNNQLADNLEKQPTQVDVSPILAWADSMTGGELSKAYKRPDTKEEREMKIAQLRNLASGAQQAITKDALSSIQATDKNQTALQRLLMATAGKNAENDKKRGLQADRQMGMLVGRIHNDPIIKPSEQNMTSLQKAMTVLQNEHVPLSPQMLADAEQDVASGLQIRGQGGTEGKINRTQLITVGRLLAEAKQKYLNQPTIDLRKEEPELVKQVLDTTKALHADYDTSINERKHTLYDEYGDTYAGNEDFQDRIEKLRSRLKPRQPPPAPPGPTWSPTQVKAAAAQLGISEADALKRLEAKGHGVK